MGRWGLNSALTTRLPSLVSSALSVPTQAIQLTPPPPLPNPGPRSPPWRAHRAPSSPVLPVRPSLPGRAAEAEALASRRLPGPGNARSSRPPHPLGRYLSSSWSSSLAGAASGILRWRGRAGGSAPCLEACGRGRQAAGRKDRRKKGGRKEGGGAAAARQGPAAGRGVKAPPLAAAPAPPPARGGRWPSLSGSPELLSKPAPRTGGGIQVEPGSCPAPRPRPACGRQSSALGTCPLR